jgi:hypothetical protein
MPHNCVELSYYLKLRSAEAQICRLAEAVVTIPAGLTFSQRLIIYSNIIIFINNYKKAIYKVHEKKRKDGISEREEKSRLNSARTICICLRGHTRVLTRKQNTCVGVA